MYDNKQEGIEFASAAGEFWKQFYSKHDTVPMRKRTLTDIQASGDRNDDWLNIDDASIVELLECKHSELYQNCEQI
jgi:hypothetical protein